LPKFKSIASLMRAAKIAKLVHGFNLYFFLRMVTGNHMLENMPSDAITKILSFIVGGRQAIVMTKEIPAVKLSSIAPAAAALSSAAAAEPEPSAAAEDVSFANSL